MTYQYDSLNRLISAVTTGPEWGQSYTYDGFGNMSAQTVTKGSAPQYALTVNSANNRISNYAYDANGKRNQRRCADVDLGRGEPSQSRPDYSC